MSAYGDIFLDHAHSGLGWMLDPDSQRLRTLVGPHMSDGAAPADHGDYLDDADLLRELILERHPACVRGVADVAAIDEVLTTWCDMLRRQKPQTRASCVGSLGFDLGTILGDAHLRVQCERRPHRSREVLTGDDGAAWQSWTHRGVRIVRIRSLDSAHHAHVLEAGARQSVEDFSHDHILVDLRGNAGGDDHYVVDWMRDYIPQPVQVHPPSHELRVRGTQLNRWNTVSLFDLRGETIPTSYRVAAHRPHPSDVLQQATVDDGRLPAGARPWTGTMVVALDGLSGSSAESSALMLRSAFDATIVGAESYGSIDYGNVCPYVLPNSGLQVQIATRANKWGEQIDFTGIRPDVTLDVHQASNQLAEKARF